MDDATAGQRLKILRGEVAQLTARADELADLISATPTPPPPGVIENLRDCLADAIDSDAQEFHKILLLVATTALALPRRREIRRWRAPSRVWVLPAATAVSPVIAPRYRLPFLCRACPARLPDWCSSGVRPAQEAR